VLRTACGFDAVAHELDLLVGRERRRRDGHRAWGYSRGCWDMRRRRRIVNSG